VKKPADARSSPTPTGSRRYGRQGCLRYAADVLAGHAKHILRTQPRFGRGWVLTRLGPSGTLATHDPAPPTHLNRSSKPADADARFWKRLVRPVLPGGTTPFYVFSIVPVRQALAELDTQFGHLPVRHWLSCKTQPLRPLLQWWQRQGRPIEVVSEFEFRAALAEGFAPGRILVNGPAKHRWLPRVARRGLRVNFDSPSEAKQLAPLARRLGWICGIRLLTREEFESGITRLRDPVRIHTGRGRRGIEKVEA